MSETTLVPRSDSQQPRPSAEQVRFSLVVAWDRREPGRTGELAWIEPGSTWVLGRIGGAGSRLRFVRHRPGGDSPGLPLTSPFLSRDQLQVTVAGPDSLAVDNVGRIGLRLNGQLVRQARARSGDVLELAGELVLLVCRRAPAPAAPEPAMPFGQPDPDGLVGESHALWELRRWLSAVGPFPGHVLVHGSSGTGKELVARALHRQSGRAGPLVTCNAAAIPSGVAEAEWFGNRKDYPNPGMPARRGLAGEADGGTLFIDEIGELPAALQAQLLRLLDSGEVQRLGEGRPSRVDVRIVAATNRPLAALKDDVLARFPHRRLLPSLAERIDDVPLLVQHLLRELSHIRAVGVRPRLWTALLRHRWTMGVRELQQVLAAAMVDGSGEWLDLTPGLPLDVPVVEPALPAVQPSEITAEQIREALAASGGVKAEAARRLGLNTRHQLRRLMSRYGMAGAEGIGSRRGEENE
jgi:DNA-binding NtrC family response regulator